MVMSPEWLRFDEEERLRLEQSKGDPARVGASPVLPGKNGWLQDLVERVTEQIATRPPQPQLNSASQRIIANRAPDVAPDYNYAPYDRTIAPLKALQGFVGDVAAEGPGFLRDPSAALDAPLLPVRTIGQGLDALGMDTGLQDLSVRNPILARLGIEAPFNTLRDVGSGINRTAGEAAIPTKPWEIALQALPAAMATSRGGNAMLREFLNLPEDALLDPAIARRFRSLFEGDFLPATAKGFWSGPGGGNPAAREVMQNLDTVAGHEIRANPALEQAYQGRTNDAYWAASGDERAAISKNMTEPQPVDSLNANNFDAPVRARLDSQNERTLFAKLEGIKADEERLAQELTDLQGGATPVISHPSQAGWTPEEHADLLRFRIGQLRREGQTYVDSLADRGSLPKGAVFQTMKPNTPSLVGPRPPMDEGAQPRMLPTHQATPPEPAPDEPVKQGTFPGEAVQEPTPYERGVKYHTPIPEVTQISPRSLKAMNMYEVRAVSPEVAAGMDFSEPIDVSVFADGELRIVDGHHRVAAALQSGVESLPVRLQAINAKGETINSLIDESRQYASTPQEPRPAGSAPQGGGASAQPANLPADADADLMQGADESDLEYAVRLRMSGLSKDEITRIEQASKDLASGKMVEYQNLRTRQFERAGRMTKRSNALDAENAANAAGERGRAAQERLAADVASRRAEAARPLPRNAAGINGPGGRAPAGEESYSMPGGARDAAQPPLQTKQAKVDQAKRLFGVTTDPARAKYLLDDGTMVGGKQPFETDAHVRVGELPAVNGSYGDNLNPAYDDMKNFMTETGAVRMVGNGFGFEIHAPVTEAQAQAMRRAVAAARGAGKGDVMLDSVVPDAFSASGERRVYAWAKTQGEVDAFLREHNLAPPAAAPGRMAPNPRTAPQMPAGGPRPGGAAQQAQPQQPYARETQAVNDAADAIVSGDDSSRAQAKFVQAVIAHANAQGGATNTLDKQIGSVLAGAKKNKDVRKMLDQVGWSKQRVENLAVMLTSGDPSIDTPEKLNRFLRNADKPTFWNKLEYYWKNNVLSGPLTQARNVVGNATTTAYAPVKRGAAAAIEQPLAFIQGRPAERFLQEAPAAVSGALHGFGPGVEAFMKTMRSGISPAAAGKAEIMRDPPLKGPIGTAFGLPLRGLSAMDELFGSINFQAMKEANAVRKAKSEGLRGPALKQRIDWLIANATDEEVAKAADQADELTFRNDPEGKTATIVEGLTKLRDGFGLPGRLAIAFLKTPANAVKYGVTNSPFGLLNIPAWRKAMHGNPEGVDELSGAFLGSALAASLAAGLESGVIDLTAGMPTNSGERDRWQREGKSAFSIKVPGVGWVEYKSLPAVNTTMLLVASVRDALKSGEDPTEKVKQAVANVSSNLYDQAYLNGLTDLMDALRDPIRYGERFATRQVGGFVPFSGAARQAAQVIDPTKRDPSGPVETLKTGIPGLSSTVRPQRNAFGAEVKQGIPLPVRVTGDHQTALDAELARLDYNVGYVTDKIGTYTLTADEQNEYQALAGSLTEQRLEKLLSGTIYRKSADEAKKKQIRATVDGARAAARAEMIKRARTAAKP